MPWENWRGEQLENAVIDGCYEAINITLESIGAVSDQQVPLDEGPLKSSKTIKVYKYRKPKGSISYGGGSGTGKPRIPYALRWHENQANFQHGRKRFYLKDPFVRLGPDLLKTTLRQKLGEVLR